MAEVALSDYIAYVFHEISRARDMADRYSKEVALAYAKDDVLRHFSVPRFKIAKMDLNMPVLVSGVQITSLMQFRMDRQDFKQLVLGLILEVVKSVPRPDKTFRTDGVDAMLDPLYDQLTAEPRRSEEIVARGWNEVLRSVLKQNEMQAEVVERMAAAVIAHVLGELHAKVKASTVTARGTLESLLVNPETNVVKNGSNDASVFTIKAELMEEALFIKSVKDEKTGIESRVVEFE